MKHPKRQSTGGAEYRGAPQNGTVTSMIGKDTVSLTFNIDVATALNFGHKEPLRYEVTGDRLIIRKVSM
jgi:hypothetical protein